MPETLTIVFLIACALTFGGRLLLAGRQIRHVRAHRDAVPAEFAERIALASHQKAADYTIDRTRTGMLNTAIEAGVLLAFTLGGGLAWLHGFW